MATYPREKCHKCGKRYWDNCTMPKTWSCVYCGNLIYFSYGAFRQQIDLVMESSRYKEFVKSECGKYIVPKMDDRMRMIRFNEKMEKMEDTDKAKAQAKAKAKARKDKGESSKKELEICFS